MQSGGIFQVFRRYGHRREIGWRGIRKARYNYDERSASPVVNIARNDYSGTIRLIKLDVINLTASKIGPYRPRQRMD
jgi:hypothetical protein